MAQRKKIGSIEELLSRKTELFAMRDLLEYIIQALMEYEVKEQIGADRYERTNSRKNSRNGHRKRTLTTGLGNLNLKIPKLTTGSFYPSILEKYQRVDRAMIAVIQEAYINGVSTRSMQNLYKEFGINNLSKSTISRMIQPILKSVEKWNTRKLDQEYVYIWLDAIETKLRDDGCVQPLNVLHAVGLRKDGTRESIGFYLNLKESYYGWKAYLQSLKKRGLKYCGLWIRDQFAGLEKAITECFPGQLQQRCLVHWQRNLLDKLHTKFHAKTLELLTPIVKPKSREGFYEGKERLIKELEEMNKPKIIDWIEETLPDIINFLNFPQKHWRKIKSTNMIERLNEELRRRERSIRIFPARKSSKILIGAILQQQSENWQTGRMYIKADLDKAIRLMKKFKNGKQNIGRKNVA